MDEIVSTFTKLLIADEEQIKNRDSGPRISGFALRICQKTVIAIC